MEDFGNKISETSPKYDQTETDHSSEAGQVGDASFHWWQSDSEDDDSPTPSSDDLNQQSSKSARVVVDDDESFNAESRRSPGHEISDEQEETVTASSTVSFNVAQPDRLKLLVKLRERNMLNVPCEITIGSNCVTLAGKQDLLDCQLKLLETLCAFDSVKVDVSPGVVKLLVSRDGEKWFDDQLAEQNLCAVCHDRGSECYVMSESGASAKRTKELLESLLTSDVRQFQQQEDAVVSSRDWKKFVEQFRGMVLVTVRLVEREIVIDGCIGLVKKAGGEIDEFLKTHSRDSQVWELESGVFDLLQMHRDEMQNDLDSDGVQQDAPT